MARPLDIEIVAPVEGELDFLALQFVDDGTIVDALDRDASSVALVIQPRAFFLDVDNVNGPHAQHFFGQKKVRQRLLLLRMNLHQNHIFWIVRSHNRSLQQFAIGILAPGRSTNT